MNALALTVITPVAAVTPASPKSVVAASVTSAVAPILTTLRTQYETFKKSILYCDLKIKKYAIGFYGTLCQ